MILPCFSTPRLQGTESKAEQSLLTPSPRPSPLLKPSPGGKGLTALRRRSRGRGDRPRHRALKERGTGASYALSDLVGDAYKPVRKQDHHPNEQAAQDDRPPLGIGGR